MGTSAAMNYSLTPLTPNSVKLSLIFPKASYNALVERKYTEKRSQLSIKGFRPGKAPLDVVKKYYAKEVESDVVEKLFQDHYGPTMEKEKLTPVDTPVLTRVNHDDPERFGLDIEVSILPKFDFDNLSELHLVKHDHIISPDELEELKLSKREHFAELVDDEEGTVKLNSVISADVQIFQEKDGAEVEITELSKKDITIDLQKDEFFQNHAAALVGLHRDESKVVELPQMKLNVTVLDIRRKELPEVNQEFLNGLKMESEAQWIESLNKEIQAYWDYRSKTRLLDDFLNAYISKYSVEVPPTLTRNLTDENQPSKDNQAAIYRSLQEEIIKTAYFKQCNLALTPSHEELVQGFLQLSMMQDTPSTREVCEHVLQDKEIHYKIEQKIRADRMVSDLLKRVDIPVKASSEKF